MLNKKILEDSILTSRKQCLISKWQEDIVKEKQACESKPGL